MVTTDPRIDAYIENAEPFARPILQHLRSLVHKTCPETVETIKWGFPHFVYKKEILCSMASFKKHCAFIFWKASLMKDPILIENARAETAMGHLGKIMSLKDLPADKQMIAYLKEAMELNDKGIKLPKKTAAPKKELMVPKELKEALSKNKKAFDVFDKASYSHRKEYIEWICEAKTETTRNKRISKTIEMLAEGKSRNEEYK
ncbi:YdeI/OmpD-associated family protein [Flavihumibacter sp.]|uniref:YdeI/OmpD-associated family protein n=1 Tax=Flavihumibacter sp. TaxID=1913981 RepID=UPI002FC73D5A